MKTEPHFSETRKLLLVAFSFFSMFGLCQTLNLPTRQPTALSGSQFEATIASSTLSLTNRENMIYAEVSAGNEPNFGQRTEALPAEAHAQLKAAGSLKAEGDPPKMIGRRDISFSQCMSGVEKIENIERSIQTPVVQVEGA